MADVKSIEEGSALPEMHKPEVKNSITKPLEEKKIEEDDIADSNKKRKLEYDESNGLSEKIGVVAEEEAKEEDAEDEDDEEEEDYAVEEDDDEVEEKVVDRKGKGVLIDTKGKGKMVEVDDDDDVDGSESDDDSSDDSDSDFHDGLDDSELEDDPLAEVDLDNILPSRTRQGGSQPGLRISSDHDKDRDA